MKKSKRASGLLQSGIIFVAISFLPGPGNYAFQTIIWLIAMKRLKPGAQS
jgi:hypothetical protein